jgi:hypothetical protein
MKKERDTHTHTKQHVDIIKQHSPDCLLLLLLLVKFRVCTNEFSGRGINYQL